MFVIFRSSQHLLYTCGQDTAGLRILDESGHGPVMERAHHLNTDEKTERRCHTGGIWQGQSCTTLNYGPKEVQNEETVLLTLTELMRLT